MRSDGRVKFECRWCGEVDLAITELSCAIPKDQSGQGLCEATCPICSRPAIVPTPASNAEALLDEGASRATGAVPFEFLEPHRGNALSWDDVFDIEAELERTCCPQEEIAA
jgi:hypothetical protein